MLAGAIYQTHAAHYQVWLIGWTLNAKREKDCFLEELCWELEIQFSPHSQAQDSFGLLFWLLLVLRGALASSRTSVSMERSVYSDSWLQITHSVLVNLL